jgi:hypothetical protein
MDRYTPVERRMLQLLADGKPHCQDEVKACLHDEQASLSNVRAHICRLRKKLVPLKQTIRTELSPPHSTHYRQIALD